MVCQNINITMGLRVQGHNCNIKNIVVSMLGKHWDWCCLAQQSNISGLSAGLAKLIIAHKLVNSIFNYISRKSYNFYLPIISYYPHITYSIIKALPNMLWLTLLKLQIIFSIRRQLWCRLLIKEVVWLYLRSMGKGSNLSPWHAT